jgi:hypothetical protein
LQITPHLHHIAMGWLNLGRGGLVLHLLNQTIDVFLWLAVSAAVTKHADRHTALALVRRHGVAPSISIALSNSFFAALTACFASDLSASLARI